SGGRAARDWRPDHNRRVHHSRVHGGVRGSRRLSRHRARLRLARLGQNASPALVQPDQRFAISGKMKGFSWDKRIRRAEQLAGEYPASEEILRFYAHIARFQENVYERLKLKAAGTLQPACLEPDYRQLVRLIQRISTAPLSQEA